MTRAGTGGARFPSFSASLSASYLLELAIIAASYFGIAKTAVLVPAINSTATPLWPPTGLALSLILLRNDRIWPAILIGSIFASAISSSPTASLEIGFQCDRHHGRSARRSLADQSLVAGLQDARVPAQRCEICAHLLCSDRCDQFWHRHSGPRSHQCFRLCRFACHFDRHLGKVVAHGRGRDCDHRSRHFALGDDATASIS